MASWGPTTATALFRSTPSRGEKTETAKKTTGRAVFFFNIGVSFMNRGKSWPLLTRPNQLDQKSQTTQVFRPLKRVTNYRFQ